MEIGGNGIYINKLVLVLIVLYDVDQNIYLYDNITYFHLLCMHIMCRNVLTLKTLLIKTSLCGHSFENNGFTKDSGYLITGRK